ncbi:MAG TPA: Crp/Fnr family transcriptional regulator [Gemmatimonadales bacterium]|nr:Crp/Fnr family transcriptional regulator [Gemmatimonadales bacterium]
MLQIVDFLSSVPLFRGLSRDALYRLAEVTREKIYARNGVICFEGDPGDALYIVRTGRVKVVLVGDDGREVILGVLGAGEYFGELSLIDDQPRSAHVIAMEDSRLLVLRREDFRKRVEANPGIAWALLQDLSQRLRQADSKIGDLVLLDVPGRIARALLDAAPDPDANVVARALTHQTIAQMIGSSRETVSRTMKDFQESGWITVERRQIRIADRAALERRALIRR